MSLKAIVRTIDALNERVGRAVSWLAIAMVFTTFVVAVLRYGFSLGWVWLQESYVWTHGIIFMVAAGYTLLHEGHVRIDIVYASVSARAKAWINLLGVMFLLMPALGVIWWGAYPYVLLSWHRLETSREAGGLHGLFLWKTSMLVFIILLGLQGIALAIRSLMVLRGHAEWDPSQRDSDGGIGV
ncbi:MAG: TRAP transporter small permease subunit [Hyphomicrobiales bacterium]|nr:TRAP transporter small permease subunit [Hyphomicrobiales bacterium]